MNLAYRSTRRTAPQKDETLVSTPEQARKLIDDLDKKLSKKQSGHDRAVYLCARAVLYEALGDPKMLEAAHQAYKFSKNSQTAALVAVALHHFGRIKEAIAFYEQSWKYPHEPGYEIDVGASGAFLFNLETWPKAWKIVRSLKKRMVPALLLNFWDMQPCENLSVVSEGGFGDIIRCSRYLPHIRNVDKITVYVPPYFLEHGFVDLAKIQPWYPEIKSLAELPPGPPAAGFFDLPALFESTPTTLPDPPVWYAASAQIKSWQMVGHTKDKPNVGFCWAARAMETPLCAPGAYRELTKEQAEKIITETEQYVHWFSLQHNTKWLPLGCPGSEIKSWMDTAGMIANLDAVVTVDTAVAHLAASMGKPTWVILSGASDYIYGLDGDRCLWYPTMRVFRNSDFGFDNSVNSIISALKGELRSATPAQASRQ